MHTNPTDFLWRALAIFLLLGALLGVIVALLLIFNPRLMARLNRMANRWISMRHFNVWLDRSIGIEQWFYQHHRALGIVAVMGSSYVFVYFGILFDKAYTLQYYSGRHPAKLLDALLDTMVLSALIGGAVALIVGLFLWLRPSQLRGMEEEANQWVSLRRGTKRLDVPHEQMDSFVAHHAQRVGWLLLLGSIYLFFALIGLLT